MSTIAETRALLRALRGHDPTECAYCRGTGRVRCVARVCGHEAVGIHETRCATCDGTGHVEPHPADAYTLARLGVG